MLYGTGVAGGNSRRRRTPATPRVDDEGRVALEGVALVAGMVATWSALTWAFAYYGPEVTTLAARVLG